MARRSACGDGARLVERLDERRGRRLGAVALPVTADEVLLAVESRLRRPGWPTSAEEGLHLRLRRARGTLARRFRPCTARAGPRGTHVASGSAGVAGIGERCGAAFLRARAPGKRVWRAWSTLVRTTREAMVLNGDEKSGASGWWKDARLGSLGSATLPKRLAQFLNEPHQHILTRHCCLATGGCRRPSWPGYARPTRRCAASSGRPRKRRRGPLPPRGSRRPRAQAPAP